MSEPQPISSGPPVPSDRGPSRKRAPTTSRRRLLADRAARWLVVTGGMAIIASILGILLFIFIEVWPLTSAARVAATGTRTLAGAGAVALVSDEHRSHVAWLAEDGLLRVAPAGGDALVLERRIVAEEALPARVRAEPGDQLLTAVGTDGNVLAVPVEWELSFVGQERRTTPRIAEPVEFRFEGPVDVFTARVDPEGSAAAAARLEDGSLVVLSREVEEDFMTGELTESWSRSVGPSPEALSVLVLDRERRRLYGGTRLGELLAWDLGESELVPADRHRGEAAITALSLLLGDRSLVVGRETGTLSVWFAVRQPDGEKALTHIRRLGTHPDAIRLIAPSFRNKGVLALDEAGGMALYHSTSNRKLWAGESPLPQATALFYTPKADGAFLAGGGKLAGLDIDNPHPEVGIRALFGKVWYEGYDRPDYVWQSTGGTDEFEPKLSLTPLMIGTFKGTVYSLILAIPLGVFGAMYTSQFMHPSYKRIVKPTVEIMAALPSVVLGFLAGLWLAPRLERVLPGVFLMMLLFPLIVLATWALLRTLPSSMRQRMANGLEVVPYMVTLSVGMWLCVRLSPSFEALVFGGSFRTWLLEVTGLPYDQRNAVVVGLAMGFAVIPVIFAIAEDAFSNVPRNLSSGSLALGASRWQTVVRVILPSASPGIFSAIMVGFGRAVGETMIVLMATGNTPILDWNPFNGFRTLSANIAVEIPEAPQGATLYRTLFLAALILFIFTFAINTVAEIIRQRLRRRYASL